MLKVKVKVTESLFSKVDDNRNFLLIWTNIGKYCREDKKIKDKVIENNVYSIDSKPKWINN